MFLKNDLIQEMEGIPCTKEYTFDFYDSIPDIVATMKEGSSEKTPPSMAECYQKLMRMIAVKEIGPHTLPAVALFRQSTIERSETSVIEVDISALPFDATSTTSSTTVKPFPSTGITPTIARLKHRIEPTRREEDPIKVLEEQREFFMGNLETLLETGYKGKFVAIFRERIVDSDEDNGELAKRVYGKYGYVPIYMGKVQRKRRIVEIPSPERR